MIGCDASKSPGPGWMCDPQSGGWIQVTDMAVMQGMASRHQVIEDYVNRGKVQRRGKSGRYLPSTAKPKYVGTSMSGPAMYVGSWPQAKKAGSTMYNSPIGPSAPKARDAKGRYLKWGTPLGESLTKTKKKTKTKTKATGGKTVARRKGKSKAPKVKLPKGRCVRVRATHCFKTTKKGIKACKCTAKTPTKAAVMKQQRAKLAKKRSKKSK